MLFLHSKEYFDMSTVLNVITGSSLLGLLSLFKKQWLSLQTVRTVKLAVLIQPVQPKEERVVRVKFLTLEIQTTVMEALAVRTILIIPLIQIMVMAEMGENCRL
jgi:hypothetical protein